jgi:LysR family glycine cleavage system transcriptional activator
LTPVGRALSDQLNAAFGQVRAAMENARAAPRDQKLRVSALPLFTSVWLIPRLSRFKTAHPDLSIEIESTHRVADLSQEGVDVTSRNIRAPTPGLDCHKLMDLRAIPLCAPEIASRLHRVEDLADETLIHVTAGRDGWTEWLSSLGFEGLIARGALSFDTIPAALEAAVHGQGVALGLAPLVWGSELSSRLVIPFETPIRSAGAYFLVHRRADRNRASVQAFTAWIRKEMRGPQNRPRER